MVLRNSFTFYCNRDDDIFCEHMYSLWSFNRILYHCFVSFVYSGELERLRKFWLAGACHSKLNQKRSSDELGILNFTSAFILLAAGIVLGGLLLILEHLYFRFGRKCLKEYDKCGCCALVSLVSISFIKIAP